MSNSSPVPPATGSPAAPSAGATESTTSPIAPPPPREETGAPSPARADGGLPAELTMEAAVERALARHATPQAARARVESTEALVHQAAVRPNPVFTFLTENWRFYGTPDFSLDHDLDLTAALSQTLETGGKRDRRVAVARAEAAAAEGERRAAGWVLRQAVRRAFVAALLAERLLALQSADRMFFEKVIDFHRARVAEGTMPELDLIRVRLEGERLAAAEEEARLESEAARRTLFVAMGEPGAGAAVRLADPYAAAPPPAPPPDDAVLADAAAVQRSEVSLARTEEARATAALDLERSLARPDWDVEVGYKHTGGFHTILAGVSVPLPLSDRRAGAITAASADVRRAEAERRAAEARARGEACAAAERVRRRLAILERLHRGGLELAEESWRIVQAAYQEGGADLLRLLEAHRTRQEILTAHIRAEMDYRLDWIDLETAVGAEVAPRP